MPDCSKLHSVTLKQKYEEASKTRDYFFEEEVLEFLNNFLRDNERKIELAKSRLHHTQDAPDNEEKVRCPCSTMERMFDGICFFSLCNSWTRYMTWLFRSERRWLKLKH